MRVGDAVAMASSFVNAWSGTYLDWHRHHLSWHRRENTGNHMIQNNIAGPGWESQMYSHYDMLCEHSWWYLYLGYISQPHHGYIHTNCYIITLYRHQKHLLYIGEGIGGKITKH